MILMSTVDTWSIAAFRVAERNWPGVVVNDRRHLSSLRRGMTALTVLSMQGRMTAAELAKRIKAPRTTAHRILNTLLVEGYVVYNPHNHCFRLAQQICRLGQGPNRDELISQVARPVLQGLCREILLPVGLTTPIGPDIVLQVSLDQEAPLALLHLPEGLYFPATYGACGRLFLAHCGQDARRELIDAAAASKPAYLKSYPPPTQSELDDIRRVGYAVYARPTDAAGVLAVPVYFRGDYIASVQVRFENHEAAPTDAVKRYLERIRRAAKEVEEAFALASSQGVVPA